MGQAFDEQGNVLAEAYGKTKREVFDSLIERAPEAHEIRIKTLKDRLDETNTARPMVSEAPAGLPASYSEDPLEQFFAFAHLPLELQAISKPFGDLAGFLCATLPRNPERTVALRKLLEAKDCAVRARLWKG